MRQHKSPIKRVKTDAKRHLRNISYKSMMKTYIKGTLASTNKEEAEVKFRETVKLIDKIASKGIIHKNRAAAHKSKIALHLNSLN